VRALLDVNVLIALLDGEHISHEIAATWFKAHAEAGWATCPLTENGCIRIMSHPGYQNPLPIQSIALRLAEACGDPVHEFWTDSLSMTDSACFDVSRLHGPRQLTDAYLLALAVKNRGRLVTFDRTIPAAAVRGANARHLLSL
jgi:uncharacterized protein